MGSFADSETSPAKEQWEPVLEKLWAVVEGDQELSQHYHISEVWAPEWPSHGESALLNASKMEKNNIKGIAVSIWGLGIAALFNEGHLHNKQVIAVSFCIGNQGLLNGLRQFSASMPPIISLIIVEPILFDRETVPSPEHKRSKVLVDIMIRTIKGQNETWPNRQEAKQYLTKRLPWSTWDTSVLESYLHYGLVDTFDVDGKPIVKTICSRAEETAAYENYNDTWTALDQVTALNPFIPIYFVFGSQDRLIPQVWKACATDASKGRKPAGVHRIEASHNVVQEKPREFAVLLSQLIREIVQHSRPKL